MEEPLVYIVISNYQGLTNQYKGVPLIKACLDNLFSKTRYKNYRVIVADDKSSDDSVAFVRKNYPRVRITIDKYGWNSARNNNSAVRSIKGHYDYVILMNNDIIITEGDWLTRFVRDARKTRADIMGCKLLYPDGRLQQAGLVTSFPPYAVGRGSMDSDKYSTIKRVGGVGAAVMLIRRECIERIGLLDEVYNFGPDDAEYCIRATRAGMRIIYDGKISMLHLEGWSTANSKVTGSSFTTFYYYQRGFIHFVKDNFGALYIPYLLLYELGNAIISVEGKDRKRGITSIRLKNKPLQRLYVTFKAWKDYLFNIDYNPT